MPVCLLPSSSAIDADYLPMTSLLSRQVQRRLQESSYRAVRHVSVAQRVGVLTLFGRVPTFYLKQIAQSIAGKVEGVQAIDNQIEVAEPAEF